MNQIKRKHFEAFYQKNSRPLWLYILRVSGDESLADDIYQEAFVRFLRKIPAGLNEFQQRSYLYRIASRLLIDRYRRKKREREALQDSLGFSGNSPADSPAVDMQAAFRKLNPKERNLLWLAYVEGYDHKEMGNILGLREKSIKVLLFRARKKISSLLEQKGYAYEN